MSNRRLVPAFISLAVMLAVGGCGQADAPEGAGGEPDATAAVHSTEAPGTADSPATEEFPSDPAAEAPADEPAPAATEHRVTFDWGTPSDLVTIAHPAAAPTPYLVAIYTGDHPEGDRPYQRMSFYFREGLPEYNFQYMPAVTNEATGEPVALDGNAFLRLGFVNAQAHDDAGESTIAVAPANSIGFQNLKSYGSAGDFEGHLTYGLGLQVAPNSDQVLQVRTGELTKPDQPGGTYHVVYVDIATG
jgi:hypothetical protein